PLAGIAQGWPARPIRWVVAYPAGGGSDFLARQLAPQLGKQLGQTIVIDNRPGAAGIIGTDNAAKSAPDGYTIVTGDNGAMVFHRCTRSCPMSRKTSFRSTSWLPTSPSRRRIGRMLSLSFLLRLSGKHPVLPALRIHRGEQF